MIRTPPASAAQAPRAGEINVDHVAHFVPDIDSAAAELTRLGFTLTPFSAQTHRLTPDGPLVPAGTGNRCIMFERGYVELLTPTGESAVADQLRAAIARYVGVHLIAFGTADAERDHARVEAQGFRPLPPVALQRPIGTESGTGTARFTVVRVPPDAMPEGRIQYCQQRTPDLVWQARWLEHRNGAVALTGVLLCVSDPEEAAQRYARYTGLPAQSRGDTWHIDTARGTLTFLDTATSKEALALEPPALPWIAGYSLATRDLAVTSAYFETAAVPTRNARGRVLVSFPAALGGVAVFEPQHNGHFELARDLT
jgi:hypothetical protein